MHSTLCSVVPALGPRDGLLHLAGAEGRFYCGKRILAVPNLNILVLDLGACADGVGAMLSGFKLVFSLFANSNRGTLCVGGVHQA